MKAGDTAKLIAIPPDAHDDGQLQTRTLFEKCLGQSFVISAAESFDGVPFPLARIDVGPRGWQTGLGAHGLGRTSIFGARGSLNGFER